MQKILSKRVVRNFLKNWSRYLALMGLILFSFFIVISLTASSETIITGTRQLAEQDLVEDGEFSTAGTKKFPRIMCVHNPGNSESAVIF